MNNVRPLRAPGGETGVGLVELMCVLVVFAVGILALAGVQTRSGTVVYATGRGTQALSVAQARIEAARAAGFDLARPDSGRVGAFDWRTEVFPAGTGLSQVRVTVTWRGQTAPDTLRLTTLLSAR